MRKSIKYDFEDLIYLCESLIKTEGKNNKILKELQMELDRFYKDSECDMLIVTENDKLFFGAMVVPTINNSIIYDILSTDDTIRLTRYKLELDSKLFNPILDINGRELLAIILHEIGHVVNTSEPIKEIREIIDEYCARNGNNISDIYGNIHVSELIGYGIKEYISKRQTLFAMRDDEILADEFVYSCGFGQDLEDILDRISSNGMKINNELPPETTLIWTLSIYKNIKMRRIGAIKTLSRAKSIIASRLEKMEIEDAIKRMNRIDDEVIGESTNNLYNLKSSINRIEYDLNDYKYIVRESTSGTELRDILRKVNIKMSILEFLTKENSKKYKPMLNNFKKLRNNIINNKYINEGCIPLNNCVKSLIYENFINDFIENNKNKAKDKYAEYKRNSIKQFEDDFYEINLRARNLEGEDDALYIIRQINTRVSIIDEYLTKERMSESDRKRWDKLLYKYMNLREKISNNHTYKNRSYGIFIQYPDIKPNNY